MNTNGTKELLDHAIQNCRSNPNVKALTLDAAWLQHGERSNHGSWLELPPDEDNQEGAEKMLLSLDWKVESAWPGGMIASATLPARAWGFQAALPAEALPQDALVQIDLSIEGHPSAILREPKDPEMANTITVIVQTEALDDADIQKAVPGFSGPIVATWFPGVSTPRSNPDGVLRHGAVVTVAEAAAHGFKTIKF